MGVHDNNPDGEANRDVELVVFYTDYKKPDFESLANLKFDITRDNDEWENV